MTETSLPSFRRRVATAVRRANPGVELTIAWTFGPQRVVWADGSSGITGRVLLTADDFAAREMSATLTAGQVMVR